MDIRVNTAQLTQLADLQSSGFLGRAQTRAIAAGLRGEEGSFFADKLRDLIERVASMPKTYEQEGRGDDAVAHLHYFLGGFDWYITERDLEQEQHQAFGWALLGNVGPDGGELGYISLAEITGAGAELDLFFSPAPLGELRQRHR